jgi:hypothetical protein
MGRAEGYIVNGIIALAFSLGVWKMTGSLWGWAVLAAPGAVLVVAGWIAAVHDGHR